MADANYETVRYLRQVALPGVGAQGQRRLRDAKIAVVGAGGIGAPALLYLAAAGAGEITVIDNGRVEESNLHRQIIFDTADCGRPKAEAAAKRLRALNPSVKINALDSELSAENTRTLLAEHTLALDCADNFPARRAVNAGCVALGLKYVYGAVYRYEGQLAVFDPAHGACYECLYPETGDERAGACEQCGVLGSLAGMIGAACAAEAIKLVAGMKETLEGRLWLFDALTYEGKIINLRRNPGCKICREL